MSHSRTKTVKPKQKKSSSPAVAHKDKPQPAATATPGLRERNKLDKERRIREAARELFIAKGFDDATTREIAVRAGVGIGTVFTYADNKRDLLFLIANEELASLAHSGMANIREDYSFLNNVLSFFSPYYKFYEQQPDLSRMILREMTFYDAGRQVTRFRQTRVEIVEALSHMAKLALEKGTLRTKEEPRFIAWVIFAIFQVETRQWLRESILSVAAGLERLRRAVTLLLSGLEATPAAFKIP